MALNEVKAEMLSIITHISVQEMIGTYMVTFLPGIQTCPLGLTSGLKCNSWIEHVLYYYEYIII